MKKLVLLLTLILGIQSVICSANTDPNFSSNASSTNYELRSINDKINSIDNKIEKMNDAIKVTKVSWYVYWGLATLGAIGKFIERVSYSSRY